MAEAPPRRGNLFSEVGSTGLSLLPGQFLQEEFQRELRGETGVKIYTEMATHPIVGAILFVIEQLITQVEWKINPFSEDSEDEEPKQFVEECLNDMSASFADTLTEVCTMFSFGWAFMEVVYKVRRGPDSDPKSKYNDAKVGWRKWALRGQNTLVGWDTDENGGIKGMIQQTQYPQSEKVTIPIEKALLFRTRVERNNPEGRSILRNAYTPWYYAKRFQEVEAIAVERDLAGLPVLKPPDGLDLWNSNDSEMVTSLANAKKLVQSIRRGEKEGVLLPFGWELELLSTGSRRQIDVGATITRLETRISQSALADFIFLGQGKTGSWALSSDKTDLFVLALKSYLTRIKEVVNRHAIPILLELNGMDSSRSPMLDHGDIETQNLAELAAYLTALFNIGMIGFPDDDLERHLRQVADLPEPPEGGSLPRLPQPEAIPAQLQKSLKKIKELRERMAARANGDLP